MLHVAVHEQIAGKHHSYVIDDTNNVAFVFALKVRQCRKPGTGPDRKDQSLPVVASCCDRRMVCDRALPACTWIIRYRAIAADDQMAPKVLRIVGPAIPFQVVTAGIDRPGHIHDLAPNESFIPGFAITDRDADRDVSLAF